MVSSYKRAQPFFSIIVNFRVNSFEKTDYNRIQRKVGITPSHHGSNELGYTCAAKFNTERNKYVIISKSVIFFLVLIILWNSGI